MTRFRKVLALIGLSGYLLVSGPCTITGDGISVLPYIGLAGWTQQLNTLLGT